MLVQDVLDNIHLKFSHKKEKSPSPIKVPRTYLKRTYEVKQANIGLIVGYRGETIKWLNDHTYTSIFVPKLSREDHPDKMKSLEITGDTEE